MEFSDQERALLRALQRDASTPLAELGQRVGMAQSSVWRKVQEFQAAGLLKARVALLDPALAGAGLCVFAHVSLSDHGEASIREFAAIVRAHAEIMECHAVAGADDYILKIRCRDVPAYERFLSTVLLRNAHVRAVTSSFALRELKQTTELPI